MITEPFQTWALMELNLNKPEAEEEQGIVAGDTAAVTEFPLSADVHSCKQDPSHF